MTQHILTINTGSATIKFSVYALENDDLTAIYQAEANKLAHPPQLCIKDGKNVKLHNVHLVETKEPLFYSAAISTFITWLTSQQIEIQAVSHRVVHGGIYYHQPVIVTDDILQTLSTLIPLAPLHQPFNLAGITQARQLLPSCPHIACFDTAFHQDMPEINRYYAIPRCWEAQGIRRYGFHGLSYAYIQQTIETRQLRIAQQKVIIAHLGQGASLCALKHGKSVLTSMGLTALDGLVMGTRCGTLDPGILLYWMDEKKLSAQDITEILYKQSGLLGLSGISADMRQLLQNNTPAAQLAIQIFVQRICHYIGMLTAELQGLDGLVFTAGIGENANSIRAAICQKLQWLGVKLDQVANTATLPDKISSQDSQVDIYVIPTNEEYMLARYAKQLCPNLLTS